MGTISRGALAGLAVVLLVSGADAQQGEPAPPLAGRVEDRVTGQPVASALVEAVRAGLKTLTRSDGSFALRGRLARSDTLRVTALGYRSARVPVPVEGQRREIVVRLDPAPIAVPGVLVTPGRRPQRAAEVPLAVVVVAADEIEAAAAASVERALEEVPGLQAVAGHPAGSNIMIRGIGAARVLVLVDGEPAAGALLENRDLSRLSTLAVERIEVVKGPLSAQYGSDALGGVINVVTREPRPGGVVEARLRGGTAGRREGGVMIGGGGGLSYRLAAGWRQQDRAPGIASADDAFARDWDLRPSFRLDASARVGLRVDLSYLRERQRWPLGGGLFGFNDNRDATARLETTLEGAGGSWRFRLFLQDYQHRFRRARGELPVRGAGPAAQRERVAKALAAYHLRSGAHQLDLGLELGRRSIEAPEKIIDNRAADRTLGAFAQQAWTTGRLLLSAGGRFTWDDRWGSAVTPTLGLAWQPSDVVRVRGAVGRGFRAPSFKELGWNFVNLQGGYTVRGDPELEPERSWQLSLGVAVSPGPGLRAEAELFRNVIDDLIETGFIGHTESGLQIFAPGNVRRAVTEGVEVALRWVRGGWVVSSGYVYLQAHDRDTGLPLDRRARHTARLRLTRTWSWRPGLRADVTARYTGEASLVGPAPSGGRAVLGSQAALLTWDARVELGILPSLRFEAGVDNLFDARAAGRETFPERRAYAGLALSWRGRDDGAGVRERQR